MRNQMMDHHHFYHDPGAYMRRPLPSQMLSFNKELQIQMALCLSNISNDYHPTTELNTLAVGLLTEGRSEFLIGVESSENLFKEDWEGGRMGRQWKGYDVNKQIAKLWLGGNKGGP